MLILLIILLLMLTAGLVGVRIWIGPYLGSGNGSSEIDLSKSDLISRSIDFEDYQELLLIGSYTLNLEQGTWGGTVTYPEYMEDLLTIEKQGSALRFSQERSFRNQENQIQIHLTLPDLPKLEIFGGATGVMKGLSQDKFTIKSEGGIVITLQECDFEQFDMDLAGGSIIHALDSKTRNADVTLRGGGDVKLHMNGGRLTGMVEGAASIAYTGELSLEDVKSSGVASVKRIGQ